MNIEISEPLADDHVSCIVDLASPDVRVASRRHLDLRCERNGRKSLALLERETDKRDLEIPHASRIGADLGPNRRESYRLHNQLDSIGDTAFDNQRQRDL